MTSVNLSVSRTHEEKITTDIISREIRLVSRPKGMPTADNFALVETELEPLEDQQVLVRNLYMSVDPYMRGRMNDRKSYVRSLWDCCRIADYASAKVWSRH
jgi:NADPH-dependent curcumin reductase CurA